MRQNKKQLGFSLVELMVVVAVIGILSTMAVSKYPVYMATFKQALAKNYLGQIQVLQNAHFAEYYLYFPKPNPIPAPGSDSNLGYQNLFVGGRAAGGNIGHVSNSLLFYPEESGGAAYYSVQAKSIISGGGTSYNFKARAYTPRELIKSQGVDEWWVDKNCMCARRDVTKGGNTDQCNRMCPNMPDPGEAPSAAP